jgi:tetratricopeptide (TPR) repeat protein
MRQKLPNLILFAVPLMFLACSILQPDTQAKPLSSSLTPPGPAPDVTLSSSTPATVLVPARTSIPSPIVRLNENDLVCPSENETAQRFYDEAGGLKANGNVTEAETLYLQAIELDPGFCDAMDNLGQLLREQNKVDEAIRWYQKSLEIVPDNPVAIQNLALAYSLQGKTENALEEYEKLTEVAPENPEGYYGLGNIYVGLDQPEKAIPYFETAEKLYIEQDSPYVADAQYNLGFSHFVLQDCQETKKYLEPIYAQFSEDGGINYALGICTLTAEPTDEKAAREYILKAQELGISIPADVLNAINEK